MSKYNYHAATELCKGDFNLAIYVCGRCRFCFERKGAVDACPDCGHTLILDATEDEILEYKRNLAEFGCDHRQGETQ